MSMSKRIALSATVALAIGSSSLYAETNTTIPQIPNEISVSIINNNTGSATQALPPSLQINAVGVTSGVNKNKKLGLHLNSVNMSTVTLQADSSVTLIKETDFLYAKFAKSGSHTITAIGKAIDGTDINATVTFDVVNRTPISNNKIFAINANEILKFDAYTYFLDEDDENLTFSKAVLPTQGSLEINTNRVSYYPVSTSKAYNVTFDVNGTDIDGSSTKATFTVDVSAESEKINLINGWNLLGNSAREGMNVSDINISGESLWAYIDGIWSQSMDTIKSKQGFWLKTNSQRVLDVKPNTDTSEFNTSAPYGWRLLSDTEAKTLKSLKFGNDAVWTYRDNTWFNANNYPDFEVDRYRGFWTLGEKVATSTQTTNTTQTFSSLNKYHKQNINQPTTVSDITGWSADGVLPASLSYSQSVVTSSKVYLLGGSTGSTYQSTVYSAQIDLNGTIGVWSTEANLPGGLSHSQSVVTSSKVYMLGGYNGSAYTNVVYSAPIDGNGSIGPWTTEANLPVGLGASQSVVTNSKVYLFVGYNSSGYLTAVHSAPIDVNGTIGVWSTETNNLPIGVSYSQAVATNSKVYLLGGHNGSGQLNAVHSAPIDANGTIGIWGTETSLLEALRFSQAVMTKSRVYLLGGNNGSYTNAVRSAPIDTNGTIGTWSTGTSLPGIMASSQTFVTKSKIYLLGGHNGSTNLTTIYSAPFADGWEITGNSY